MLPFFPGLQSLLLIIAIPVQLLACNHAANNNPVESKPADSTALYKKYQLEKIKLPPGFHISVYAEVPNARSMCLSPSGVLYVGNRGGDKVYAVVDSNKDGKGDRVYTVASGLNMPNGVAFRDGHLYIATLSSILRIDDIEKDLAHPPGPVVVYDQYPAEKQHGWKFIAFGPDGKLYVPVGAPCNVCKEDNPVFATITRMNADGTGLEVYASGIRNTVGFAWHPLTKQLWFTDNGRDNLGENIPGDELNTASKAGLHFGFPFCHQGNLPDPRHGKASNCSDYTPPVQILGPHVAALGMRFYTGTMFDSSYRNQVFIAEHGSWNRSQPIGYRVSLVKLDPNGRSLGYTDFATGWLQPAGKIIGRPVDVEIMPDGSLLISDDYNGVVYRVVYR